MVTKSFYFCSACPDSKEEATVPVCRNCLSLLLLGECAECSASWEAGADCCYPSLPCRCECHKVDKKDVGRRLIEELFPHVTLRDVSLQG